MQKILIDKNNSLWAQAIATSDLTARGLYIEQMKGISFALTALDILEKELTEKIEEVYNDTNT